MYNIHLHVNVKVAFLGIYIMFMWELDIISVNVNVNEKYIQILSILILQNNWVKWRQKLLLCDSYFVYLHKLMLHHRSPSQFKIKP